MDSKRLLLVSANQHIDPYPVYPLGIAYLSSYLSSQMPELSIEYFDFMTGTFDAYVQCISNHKPDFIGISLRNIDDVNLYKQKCFIDHYKKIVQCSKESSNAVIIIGGAGYSIFPENLFKLLEPDYGIIGEGEVSLYKLLNALIYNQDYQGIDGLVFTKDGNLIKNGRKSHIHSPTISLFGIQTDYYWQYSGMLNLQTKRGCPYHCIYCTYPLIEGHRVRNLNPELIVTDIAKMMDSEKIDYIFFTDSVFNINNDFNLELAERMISANLNIHWGGYFNFANLDRKLLTKFKQAGLSHIEFGTESLSDTVLKKYKKPFSVDDILNISSICHDLKIDIAHFLILGGYGETEQTLLETFDNSTRIARSVFFPFIGMRIYPGTQLHKIAIREGCIDKNNPLLEPAYYVSKDIDLNKIRENARKTGKTWIFPEEDMSVIMNRMRKKGKKGPLWEYLLV
jgi:radical SAM superfamily enzyme YgiQ (UPF0313 family)